MQIIWSNWSYYVLLSLHHHNDNRIDVVMINDDEVRRRLQSLQEEMQLYGLTEVDILQRLHHKQKVTLPSGSCLDPLDPSLSMTNQLERKRVAILGDTDNACDIIPLIYGCDVLVHEATMIPTRHEMSRLMINHLLWNDL